MKLDNRLMAIANLVRKDKVFADIGTDHAYLPVYLVSNTSIPYIPRYDTSALGLAKKAMDLGIVVLPVNRKTTAWIQQATSITPPEYPKVAYVQNKQ